MGPNGVEDPPGGYVDDTCLIFPSPLPRVIIPQTGALPLLGTGPPPAADTLVGCSMYLGQIPPRDAFTVIQSFHLNKNLGNEGQTDQMRFDEDYVAMQINAPNSEISPPQCANSALQRAEPTP